jgi:long-chain acyl-CoA synthetase
VHIADHAAGTPEKIAVKMAGGGAALNFRELDARSNQSARALRRIGLTRGDVVATLFGNAPEVFIFGWAAQRIGLYATAISTKLSDKDVSYIVGDSGAKVLIVSPGCAGLARQAALDHPEVRIFCWGASDGAFPDWTGLAGPEPSTPVADENPGTDLLYSSGTTGRPKGVKPPLPAGPVDEDTAMSRMGATQYGFAADSIYLSTSPLYHAAPLRWAMAMLQLGGTVVVMERFDAEETLALIERERITHATFVPTHFVRMLQLPEETRLRYDVSSLRAVIHAAAPCPVPIKQAMIDWFGPIVFEYYAGTECCGITAIDSHEWLRRPGSVGRAVLGTIHVVGEDGEELPAGQAGQIYFSDGPKFEYLNDPAKTADAHNAQGWATLGDVGRVDEEGYLFITDRKNFMIISGGVNIYPQEIENCLLTHPMVRDVAVIGAPCDEMGESVVAIVEPRELIESGDAFVDDLKRFVRAELGGLKTPKTIEIVSELAREPTGKLLKKKIRDDYLARRA